MGKILRLNRSCSCSGFLQPWIMNSQKRSGREDGASVPRTSCSVVTKGRKAVGRYLL